MGEDIATLRVYTDRRAATRTYVVGDLGIATVDISDDQIGRFGLDYQCTARDVDGRDDRLAVATTEDVLVGTGEEYVAAGFGPASAVGVVAGENDEGGGILAAAPDGRVAMLTDGEWTDLGEIEDVRAIDGDLIAAAGGVYTVDEDSLAHAGLDDVRDVAGAERLVATGTGVYERADGWNRVVDGDATVVASDGDRAHCVVDGTLSERVTGDTAPEEAESNEDESDGTEPDGSDRESGADAWVDADAPVADVVDVAYGRATVAVTADGTVALDPVAAKDGSPEWRSRSLGLRSVAGVAIP